MMNAWRVFWAVIARIINLADISTASLETAALEGQNEVNNWATLNGENRAERLVIARANRAQIMEARRQANSKPTQVVSATASHFTS